jgi:hypothetical protein
MTILKAKRIERKPNPIIGNPKAKTLRQSPNKNRFKYKGYNMFGKQAHI